MSVKFDDTRATPEPGGLNLTPEKRAMAAAYKGSINHGQLPEPVAPTWLTNCCHCGHMIDKRERADGGDKFGAELSDGRWTCSFECYAAVVPDDAPTPSPDIAGLVTYLQNKTIRVLPSEMMAEWTDVPDPKCLEAATALQRVAQERDASDRLVELAVKGRDAANEAVAELIGALAAAEARIATARDEGLEMAAKHIGFIFPLAAAAIRALKGTKP